MKCIACYVLFFITTGLFAQSNRFMSLDIEHASSTKRIKYFVGDEIIYKVKQDRNRYHGVITMVSDTGIMVDTSVIVLYKEIAKVLVNNSNSLTKVASVFLKGCGIGYIGLDILNNLINSNKPIINPLTIEIGAGLFLSGQIIRWLSMKHYKINKKHRIKFIDDAP
jgi:hypothetical protein